MKLFNVCANKRSLFFLFFQNFYAFSILHVLFGHIQHFSKFLKTDFTIQYFPYHVGSLIRVSQNIFIMIMQTNFLLVTKLRISGKVSLEN